MKFQVVIVVVVTIVATSLADKTPIEWYDCADKANGNYPHPVDCTRFVTCSNEIASERDCAVCAYHPIRCPEGRLIFDKDTNQCLFAHQANCHSLCDIANRSRAKVLRGEKLV